MIQKSEIGVFGLGVMGSSLAKNIQNKGFSVSVYDRESEVVNEFMIQAKATTQGFKTLQEFVESLKKPRRILMMVTAGKVVDIVMESLKPFLEKGDILIDAGNSYYQDTQRREKALKEEGFYFIGMGVSGGEKGALEGPSMMPSGDKEAYAKVQPIFEAIAAKNMAKKSCCSYIGPDGAGHFVKMVHNGIEYADMQLIAETVQFMRTILHYSLEKISQILIQWNEGRLSSYLMHITSKIVLKMDEITDKPLIDVILDCAGQKGTGNWTSKEALSLGVATPAITDAVFARVLSGKKEQRMRASSLFAWQESSEVDLSIEDALEEAIYAAKVTCYSQGFDLIRTASKEYGWNLDLAQLATCWQAGCIIQSALMVEIAKAYDDEPDLETLLMSKNVSAQVNQCQKGWRKIASMAIQSGLGMPTLCGSLTYFDCARTQVSVANIIQAQRDFFGAHTYQRIDRQGSFHTQWE